MLAASAAAEAAAADTVAMAVQRADLQCCVSDELNDNQLW